LAIAYLPSGDAAMAPAYPADVLRPIAACSQDAMRFDVRSSVRLTLNITRCRARIERTCAARAEIDLCLCEWTDADNQGCDAN
jgi:hypothetical protein